MIENVFYIALITLLFGFISWRKHKKHKNPKKQWEGKNPNKRMASNKVLEQEQNKYRGFEQISM
ncbi:hypothetical protein ACW2QC_18275 [Virgibacillus sp. FSP13]